MSSSNAVSELAEGERELPERAGSLVEKLGPEVARQAGSGNLAAASGVVSLVRAGRTFLRGNRKRAVLQALAGLFWVGVALAQHRSGESGKRRSGWTGPRPSGAELSEVADTSPDVEEAVEPGGHESDHATGEEVVNTTDADIEGTELDESPDIGREAADADVDQRDVVETGAVEDVAESDEEGETGGADVGEPDEIGTEDETDGAGEVGDVAETSEAGESESETGSVQARETDYEGGTGTDHETGAETEGGDAEANAADGEP